MGSWFLQLSARLRGCICPVVAGGAVRRCCVQRFQVPAQQHMLLSAQYPTALGCRYHYAALGSWWQFACGIVCVWQFACCCAWCLCRLGSPAGALLACEGRMTAVCMRYSIWLRVQLLLLLQQCTAVALWSLAALRFACPYVCGHTLESVLFGRICCLGSRGLLSRARLLCVKKVDMATCFAE